MISYERIDKSEGIDFKRGGNSVKCMICNYYYFKNIGFKYQPYICNGCHNFSITAQNLSDCFVVTIKMLTIESILQVLIKKQLFLF